ncbi:hypothetical protein HZS_4417 [Henneguya salminicola]|nr:hypothetical protein HZS_4417 [Henneguya salminicola]
MEYVGLIIKLFAEVLSLVDIKIDTIHMRTPQQNTMPVYNQINRQLIELMERRDTIPIITLLEQILYLRTSF